VRNGEGRKETREGRCRPEKGGEGRVREKREGRRREI